MTFAWLLAQVVDGNDNGISVIYDRQDAGVAYPSQVRYGLRRSSNQLVSLGPNPDQIDRVVSFVLEPRPDVSQSYIAGFERTPAHRLDRIDVRVAGDLVRRYDLNYGSASADSFRSLLRSVSEYGVDADAVAPTAPRTWRFEYRSNIEAGTTDWESASGWELPGDLSLTGSRSEGQTVDAGTRLADINGDGLLDAVQAITYFTQGGASWIGPLESHPSNGVYLNNGSGFSSTPIPSLTLPFSTRHDFITTSFLASRSDTTLIDVNRDGKADAVRAGAWTQHTQNYPAPGWSLFEFDENARNSWVVKQRSANFDGNLYPPGFYWQDSNLEAWSPAGIANQGLAGYSFTNTHFYGGGSTLDCGTGGGPFKQITTGRTLVGDLDGDGRPDLLTLNAITEVNSQDNQTPISNTLERSYSLARRDGAGFDAPRSDHFAICSTSDEQCIESSIAVRHFYRSSGCAFGYTGVKNLGKRLVDVNGDGLSDLIFSLNVNGTLKQGAYINNGRDFVQDNRWNVPIPLDSYDVPTGFTKDEGVRFIDINGDGRLDLVKGAEGTPFVIRLNTGNPASPWVATADWVLPSDAAFADQANGSDRGVRSEDIDGDGMVDLFRAHSGSQFALLNTGKVPDLMVESFQPEGGARRYDYRSSTTFDNPELPIVRQVVTSLEVDDARESVSRTEYAYSGGVYDPALREFRGFETVTTTGPTGITTTASFHVNDPLAGMLASREVRDASGVLWQRESFDYQDDPEPPFLRLLERRTLEEYDGNEDIQPRTLVSEFAYDAFGNRSRVTSFGEVNEDDRISETVYTDPNLIDYIADRPAIVRAIDGDDGVTVLEETRLFYDGAADPLAPPTRGNLTKRIRVLAESGQPDPTDYFGYDVYGNRTSVANGRGYPTYTRYDTAFHTFPVEQENALGHITRIAYAEASCPLALPAGAGLPHRVTDPNQKPTIHCYDAFGRKSREALPDGLGTTTVQYVDTPGQVSITARDVLGGGNERVSQTFLDGLGRLELVQTDGPRGAMIIETTSYDLLGRLRRQTLPHFASEPEQAVVFDYDPLGRVTRQTGPGDRSTFATRFRATAVTYDANGNRRDLIENAFGEVREVREYPDGPMAAWLATQYGYDHAGRLTLIRPPPPGLNDTAIPDTVIGYDRLGRRRALTDPDAGLTVTTYDENDNPKTETDANGITVTNVYDELDRLRSSSSSAAEPQTVTLTYDEGGAAALALGRLTSAQDPVGAHTFGYDALGRRSSEQHDIAGKRFQVGQTYDALGQPAIRTHPPIGASPSATIEHRYDRKGYLASVVENQRKITLLRDIQLDGRLRVLRATTGDGVTRETPVDPRTDRLAALSLRNGSRALESRSYQYQPGGQVLEILDRLRPEWNQDFLYDNQDRLTQATGPYGLDQSSAVLGYQYDRYGNLRLKDGVSRTYGRSTTGLPATAGAIPHAVTNVAGQALSYDSAGNLRTFGSREYRWDGRGRLQSVLDGAETKAVYTYDFESRRARTVEGASTRYFVTDDFEWDQTHATVHVFGAGQRLASLRFPYQPPVVVASSQLSPSRDPFVGVMVASVLGGPPALMLLFLLGAVQRRRGIERRGVLAVVTASAYWLALTAPMNAVSLDSDSDGLRDYEELAYGTDPANPDSDGDGQPDGAEVAAGSDPLVSTSVPALSLAEEAGAGEASPGRFSTLAALAEATADGPTSTPRIGYERARGAATRDGDDDHLGAAWDANDASALVTATKLVDTDGDGLANPFDTDDDGDGVLDIDDLDNDNDGIPDAQELTAYGTNPYSADSDGDGLRDAAELRLGTNPLLADTDADGVADGLDAAPINPYAKTIIAADGDVAPLGARDGEADLADALVLSRMAQDDSLASASDREHGDVAPGSGDGSLNAADVLLLVRNAKGQDVDGDGLDASAERAAGTSPFRSDSDGDGLSDDQERTPFPGQPATNPSQRDSDGDGRLDSDEVMGTFGVATDPNDADSDDDGINDAQDAEPMIAIRYYHGDHLGSSIAVTNARGDLLDRAIYKPFGEVVARQGAAPGFGFTGQRFESSVSILDYGARFYDPALGRFLSSDPLVAFPHDPQQLNRYSYVRNSPLSLVDPTGLTFSGSAEAIGDFTLGGGVGDYGDVYFSSSYYDSFLGTPVWSQSTVFDFSMPLIFSALLFGSPDSIGPLTQPMVLDFVIGGYQSGGLRGALDGVLAFADAKDAYNESIGLVAGGKEFGFIAGEAGPLISAFRYVGPGEFSIIEKTGLVPNLTRLGQPKNISLTPLEFRSASQAEEVLAIGRFDPRGPGITPTHGVEVDLRGVPLSYGGTGATGAGGIEIQTPAAVRALRIFELEP